VARGDDEFVDLGAIRRREEHRHQLGRRQDLTQVAKTMRGHHAHRIEAEPVRGSVEGELAI